MSLRRLTISLAAAVSAVVAVVLPVTAVSASSTVVATHLRANGMSQPLGMDDLAPVLSWQVTSRARGIAQTAYQVQAASTRDLLTDGDPDLWDTGRVDGVAQRIEYAGAPLSSRDLAWWRIRVWREGAASAWSEPTWFEAGLTSSSDWRARWIAHEDWQLSDKPANPVRIELPETTARYVRLEVTGLGLPLAEQTLDAQNRLDMSATARRFPQLTHRVQLAEVQVRSSADPATNLASGRGKFVAASETETLRKTWEPGLVTDDIVTSNPQESTASGWQSAAHPSADVSERPILLIIDLGAPRTFDEVLLYPRTDTLTTDGRTAGFPVDYSVQTAAEPAGPFTSAAEIDDQAPPEPWLPAALPVFSRDFDLPANATSARLYVSGLGVYVPSLNGQRVGDAVLEPANTDFRDRVTYAAYDVTGLLRGGANTLGLRVGNGTANALHTSGRYRKFARTTRDPQVIAQLEVTMADGTRTVVATDESWRTSLGATTSSNWYGGEDYDAGREQAGWDAPGASRAGWEPVIEVGAPQAALTARHSEPVRVVERLTGVEQGRPAPETRVYDIGRNIAGIPELTIDAPRGTTVRIYPAEALRNGHADQSISNVGAPLWDQYTSAGGRQTWNPDFTYHGFRYLEVIGVPDGVQLSVAGLRVMADNESAGSFDTSNDVLDGIHRLTRRALENNMVSVLTDCPSREKLGWLEQTHLIHDTIARNYDVEAYLTKIVQDVADGQEASGLVPSTVPDYVTLAGAYRNDPNWGGALVRIPVQHWRTYGDDALIRRYYPDMQRYLAFLEGSTERWRNGVYDYGLGDWATTERPAMPRPVTGTFGVWAVAEGLADAAAALDRDADAATYRARADELAAAVWRNHYDPAKGLFGGGGMGATALALDMGAVPAEHRKAQLDHLVGLIEGADWHLVMGEISFPSVLRVLSEAGRDDVVLRIASQTTSPSLGFQVVSGNTALGEFWDGGSGQSQNHFMLGAMDAWLMTRLTGIDQADDSAGFRRLVIDPAIVGDLAHAEGSYATPYGEVRSAWRRDGSGVVLEVTVPSGSTAEVRVPVHRDADGAIRPSAEGARLIRIDGDEAVFEAGSGTWTFRSPTTR
jgi:alpha-L-rhamnosidase